MENLWSPDCWCEGILTTSSFVLCTKAMATSAWLMMNSTASGPRAHQNSYQGVSHMTMFFIFSQGWLEPKALTRIHRNSKVEPLRIVLDHNSTWMGNLPSTWFPVHPIVVRVFRWTGWIYLTNHVGTRDLPLRGDRCQPACLHPFKVFIFERRQ